MRRATVSEIAAPQSKLDGLADTNIPDEDENHLKLLMSNKIASVATEMGLTQAQIADITGLAQSDVSRIVNGNLKDYSVWRLIRILNGLGQDISIEFSRSPTVRGRVSTKSAEIG